jgi:peptidoglycan/xylan/chitin deacetylase (PgdA/CDA1 family)
VTNYTDGDAKWYFDPVAITAGNNYNFTDYFSSTAPTEVDAAFTMSDGTTSYMYLNSYASTGGAWQQSNLNFTAPAGSTNVTIYHLISGNGNLTVDDYSLTQSDVVLPPPPPPGNFTQIPNPSLETATVPGTPDNWHTGGWGTNTGVFNYPVSGLNGVGASITMTNYTNGDAKWYFDPVTVSPGTGYTFVDNFNSTAPTEVDAAFTMSDGSTSYMYLNSYSSTEGLWQKSNLTFTAPAGSTKVTIFHMILGNGNLTVDDFSLTPNAVTPSPGGFSTGMVTLTFDDGWTSQYNNALPVLQENGLKGSFYIITQPMKDADAAVANGEINDYMTTVQVKALQTAGNEVSAHTVNHCNLVTLLCPDAEIPNSKDPLNRQQEIVQSKNALLAAGITPVNTFVYPYGEYNNRVITILKNQGFIGARSVDDGFNTKTTDKYALKSFNIDRNTTVAQVKTAIDTAIANKYWLILTFHQVENTLDNAQTEGTTKQLLSDVAAYLKQQQTNVVTMGQGLAQM